MSCTLGEVRAVRVCRYLCVLCLCVYACSLCVLCVCMHVCVFVHVFVFLFVCFFYHFST